MKCTTKMGTGMLKMAKAAMQTSRGCKTPVKQADDLVETLQALGKFKTLLLAAENADLVETLRGKGPYTLFAPSDEAFAKVPAETLKGLLKDPAKLKTTLSHHLVAGVWKPEGWMDMISIKALEGQPLRIVVGEDNVTVDHATVTFTSIRAANGVVHVIDTVLLVK